MKIIQKATIIFFSLSSARIRIKLSNTNYTLEAIARITIRLFHFILYRTPVRFSDSLIAKEFFVTCLSIKYQF